MGRGDDQARRRQGHALRHHDDRLGRPADRDLGHRRRPDGLPARLATTSRPPAVNPEAGIAAMQWVLDLFDKWKVSAPATSPTATRRSAPARARSSGPAPGRSTATSQQKLPFRTYLFPTIGEKRVTYFEMGGMELYKQRDKGRYEATMQAVKWLSDNSFLWTTVGRGASPAQVDPGPARLQDRGPALERARRLRRGHELRDAGRDPGRRRARLHDLLGRQLPRQDAGGRVGRPGPSRRTRWPRSRRSGRRTSTPDEPAGLRGAGLALAHRGVAPPVGIPARATAPVRRPRTDWAGYAFVAFFTIPFLLFNVAPVLFGVYVSFTSWEHHRRRRTGSGSTTSAPPSATSGCAPPSSTSPSTR